MSKILMNVTLFHTKLFVNTYTALTLPFYTIYQRPWQKLKLSKLCRVNKTIDKNGKTIWTRKGPPGKSPQMACRTFVEALDIMDRSQVSIGTRDVFEERIDLDENGNPVVIDGKILKKIVLGDKYKWMTVGEVFDKVDNIAKGLYNLGIRKGDRVIIYAETQPNWFFCSLAIAKLNATLVTLYSNLGNSGVIYGMNQTKAKFVITTEDLKEKLLTYIDKVPEVKTIVYMRNKTVNKKLNSPVPDSINVKFLGEVIEDGSKTKNFTFLKPEPEDIALIMYTSGTTSLPKAVLITHNSLMSNIKGMMVGNYDNNFDPKEQLLGSFLPLGHIFGYVFNIYMFIYGSRVGFANPFTILDSSPAHVPGQTGDLKLIKPKSIIVVPLVLERIQKEIYAKLNKKSSLAAPLFTYFMDYKIRWRARGFDTPIINKLICEKIRKEFGGELEWIGCGGAALHHQIQAFTGAALNVNVMNAYGATETCGGVFSMSVDDRTIGSVGTPFEGVYAKLEDWPEGGYFTNDKPNSRGEIVIGGESITSGYFEMPDETEEVFKEDENGVRWFYTGDIGEIDELGKLSIIDRKKDLSKLPNGEYVSLGKVESGLRSNRYVENICICTDLHCNELVALISPNQKVLKELAKNLQKGNLTHEEMCDDEEINSVVLNAIKQSGVRADLKNREIPSRIKLTSDEWTPDNNLLTAAFKLKRKHVYKHFQKDIEKMFASLK